MCSTLMVGFDRVNQKPCCSSCSFNRLKDLVNELDGRSYAYERAMDLPKMARDFERLYNEAKGLIKACQQEPERIN